MTDPIINALAWPVTPVIPAQVHPGEVILSSHENQIVQCLSDLWANIQAVPSISVPSARKINTTAPLAGGGDLSADRTLSINLAAAQTPWLADINASGHSLSNVSSLTLQTALATAYGGTGIVTAGTTQQVLIGGTPHTWGAVDLGTMVTGTLPAAKLAAPGATGQMIYNSGGAFAGISGFTFDGGTVLRFRRQYGHRQGSHIPARCVRRYQRYGWISASGAQALSG